MQWRAGVCHRLHRLHVIASIRRRSSSKTSGRLDHSPSQDVFTGGSVAAGACRFNGLTATNLSSSSPILFATFYVLAVKLRGSEADYSNVISRTENMQRETKRRRKCYESLFTANINAHTRTHVTEAEPKLVSVTVCMHIMCRYTHNPNTCALSLPFG